MDLHLLLVSTLEEGLKAGNLWALSEKVLAFVTAYLLLKKQFNRLESKIDQYGGRIVAIEEKQAEDTREIKKSLDKLELQVHFLAK